MIIGTIIIGYCIAFCMFQWMVGKEPTRRAKIFQWWQGLLGICCSAVGIIDTTAPRHQSILGIGTLPMKDPKIVGIPVRFLIGQVPILATQGRLKGRRVNLPPVFKLDLPQCIGASGEAQTRRDQRHGMDLCEG